MGRQLYSWRVLESPPLCVAVPSNRCARFWVFGSCGALISSQSFRRGPPPTPTPVVGRFVLLIAPAAAVAGVNVVDLRTSSNASVLGSGGRWLAATVPNVYFVLE